MLINKLLKAICQKFISTPGKIRIVKATIAVLIMMVEIPIVKIASGNAKVLIKGFTIAFNNEKTNPATTKYIQACEVKSGLIKSKHLVPAGHGTTEAETFPSQKTHNQNPKLEARTRKRKPKN